MVQLSFLVYAESDRRAKEVESLLLGTGMARVTRTILDPGALKHAAFGPETQAVLLDLGEKADLALDAFSSLPAPRPLLFLCGPQDEPSILLKAMRLGAREFFTADASEHELQEAIERVLCEYPQPTVQAARKRAPVLAVCGVKGGLGATTVSCQLAAALQRSGRVALVDLDLRAGDVALYFDVKPPYTLANLGSGERLDATYVRTLLEGHRCGVRVLAAPDQIEEVETIGTAQIERAIGFLRDDFDWVILDVPATWEELSLRAFDLADQLLMVTGFEVPALHHARRHLAILERLGHARKIRLIANREGDGTGLGRTDVEKFLRREPDALIPNDFPSAALAIDGGMPLADVAPRTKITLAFEALANQAHEWCGRPVPETTEKRSTKLPNFVKQLRWK